MWRIPFLIYCVAAWEVFLFQSWLAINLLMFGMVVVGRRLERASESRKAAGESDAIERGPIYLARI
jgi:hypothetical protein